MKIIVQGNNTLMDDLSKNLENYPEFREFMFSVAVNGTSYAFTLLNPMVSMGNMFSYIKNKDGRVAIHNLVFEEALFLYFTVDYAIKNQDKLAPFQSNYILNGHLNMNMSWSVSPNSCTKNTVRARKLLLRRKVVYCSSLS